MGTSVKIMSTTFAAATSTGDQTITISGFGFTPKAAIIWSQPQSTTGTTPASSYRHSIGFTDGTNTRCNGFRNQYNVGTTATARSAYNNGTIISQINESATSSLAQASFSAFVSDGITINWSVAAGTTFQCGLILFGGDDLEAYCNSVTLNGASHDINTVGFEPSVVFTMNGSTTNYGTSIVTGAIGSFGMAANDGSDSQCTLAQQLLTANAVQSGRQYTSSSAAIALYSTSTLQSFYNINTFDSSGFTVSRSGAAGTYYMGYLAINLSDYSASLVRASKPTSAGSQAVTGFGFRPSKVVVIGAAEDTLDIDNNSGAGGLALSHTFGYFDATTQWVANGCALIGEDPTDNTMSNLNVTDAVQIIGNDGTSKGRASLTSFDADGFTLNWSASDSTASNVFYLAIEGPAATATSTGIPVQCVMG